MPTDHLRPDWREPRGYAHLAAAEPAAFAWEWLRRDIDYQAAAAGAELRECEPSITLVPAAKAAERWGLHAFEHPTLNALEARPLWRRAWHKRVLSAAVEAGGSADDLFDLERFAPLATLVTGGRETERLLLADGGTSLRIDVEAGSLLSGPIWLAWHLAGFSAIDGPLDTLRRLVRLRRTGRLGPAPVRSRNRRLILLLRAGDALDAGANQRDIAALLDRAPAPPRWRSEVPSLRLRAQRLAKGAKAMAGGGWRAFLEA